MRSGHNKGYGRATNREGKRSDSMICMNRIKEYLSQMRPAQWVKNLFVLAPLFFSGRILEPESVVASLAAVLVFCLVSSSIYCLNDIIDLEADRHHPVKRRRPLASGRLSVADVALEGVLLALGALLLPAVLPVPWLMTSLITGVYILMNVGYSLGLKRKPIVDIFIIATGFVLRVVLGAVVCSIWLSPWLVILTFIITLFLATAKRRDDLLTQNRTGVAIRESISGYNLTYLDTVLCMLATVAIVCYVIYTVSPDVQARFGTEYLYVTSIFVLAGLLRYLQLTLVNNDSGSPTRILLHDRFLQTCIAGWVLTFVIVTVL